MKGELTQGPPLRRLATFGLPLVIGSVAHALFNLVDVWLVGRYAPSSGATDGGLYNVGREAALAAIHVSSVLNFLPMLVANGISVATIATVSRAVGAGQTRRCAELINRSLLVAVLLGFLLALVTGATARWQIEALNVPREAHDVAVRCLQILSFGSVTMFALLQVTAIDRAAGRSVPPLIVLTGANIVNAAAAIYAIPRWGAVGAAWATVLSRGLFALIGIGWLYLQFPELRVRLGKFRDVLLEAKELIRVGTPASLQIFSRALAVLLVTRLLAPDQDANEQATAEATDATAAYGVALRLEMIAMFACAGWGTAGAAAVGQNLGAGQTQRAIRMGWLAAGVTAIGMVILGAAFYLLAPKIFPFFLEEEQAQRLETIVRYGTEYFRIVAFAYAFVGIGIVLAEAMNGAGATRISFMIDFVAYVVLLTILSFVLRASHGRSGLWISLVIVHGAVALAYAYLFPRVLRSRSRVSA